MIQTKGRSAFLQAPLVLLLIAIIVRIKVFIEARSLFIDESNLARNIIEKNIGGFFAPLDYEQYAPPLFLVESKMMTWLFGANDWSFRLIPFLAGLVTLVLLYAFLKRLSISTVTSAYIVALFGFSTLAIQYSTECKQYSTDACLAILLIYFAWIERDDNWTWKSVLRWGTIGAISIWYSMPIVFVLAAIGLFFLARNVSIKLLFWVGLMWMLSFVFYYSSILSKDVFDGNLQSYHDSYFFDYLPTSLEDFVQNLKLLESLIKVATDKTAVGIGFGLVLFLAGLRQLWRREWTLLILLLMPMVFTILVSGLQMYSLIPRMILFLVPLILLIMAIGLDKLWSNCNRYTMVLMGIMMFVTVINKEGYRYLVQPLEIEQLKDVMIYVADQDLSESTMWVDHETGPAFRYYNELRDNRFEFSSVHYGGWADTPYDYQQNNSKDFLIVYSHTEEDKIAKHLLELEGVDVELLVKVVGASCYKVTTHLDK